MELQTEQSKSNRRIHRSVKCLIFFAAFLIIGMIVLWIAANFGNHPYLFFFQNLIFWTALNPFLIGLLLWVFRRYSIACHFGQATAEAVQKAAQEKENTPRKLFILACVGLSLIFFIALPGPRMLFDLPYLNAPTHVQIHSVRIEHETGVNTEHRYLEGRDRKRNLISLHASAYTEKQFEKRKNKNTSVQVYYLPHTKILLYFSV
jgi:hypothetical protein